MKKMIVCSALLLCGPIGNRQSASPIGKVTIYTAKKERLRFEAALLRLPSAFWPSAFRLLR